MSDISAFESIWNDVILRAIKLCESELNPEFKEKAIVKTVDINDYKIHLEQIYKRKRQWLKMEYLPNEDKPTLDFHKLSSIMCRSMIGLKLFTYDITESENMFVKISSDENIQQNEKVQWQINNVYINYKLAFLVAEGIIFADLLFWAQGNVNELRKKYDNGAIENNVDNVKSKLEIYTSFIEVLNSHEGELYSYKTSSSHDDFRTSAIIALMKNDFLKRDFDYLQFSLSMFQWQEYTKKQHLYDLLNVNNFGLTLSDIV